VKAGLTPVPALRGKTVCMGIFQEVRLILCRPLRGLDLIWPFGSTGLRPRLLSIIPCGDSGTVVPPMACVALVVPANPLFAADIGRLFSLSPRRGHPLFSQGIGLTSHAQPR
jgi:hypothetical protein